MEGEGNEVKYSKLWEEVAPGVSKKPNLFNMSGMDLGNIEIIWQGEAGEFKTVNRFLFFIRSIGFLCKVLDLTESDKLRG